MLVAEVADSSVVSQVYANSSEGGGLQQRPSVVGTIGQARNTHLGSLHTVAATSENLVSLSARSWQVAKVADNNAVLHISANYNNGEDLQQLPSMVGTIGQPQNTQLGLLHIVAATSENIVSLSARSWQVAKVADNDAV